jgi:hypothetical protein
LTLSTSRGSVQDAATYVKPEVALDTSDYNYVHGFCPEWKPPRPGGNNCVGDDRGSIFLEATWLLLRVNSANTYEMDAKWYNYKLGCEVRRSERIFLNSFWSPVSRRTGM